MRNSDLKSRVIPFLENQQDFVGHTESDLIVMIAEKTAQEVSETESGERFLEAIGGSITLQEVLKAVHAINPLRLDEMLTGRPQDRSHDVLGCLQYFDWSTNALTDFFSPRYTK